MLNLLCLPTRICSGSHMDLTQVYCYELRHQITFAWYLAINLPTTSQLPMNTWFMWRTVNWPKDPLIFHLSLVSLELLVSLTCHDPGCLTNSFSSMLHALNPNTQCHLSSHFLRHHANKIKHHVVMHLRFFFFFLHWHQIVFTYYFFPRANRMQENAELALQNWRKGKGRVQSN